MSVEPRLRRAARTGESVAPSATVGSLRVPYDQLRPTLARLGARATAVVRYSDGALESLDAGQVLDIRVPVPNLDQRPTAEIWLAGESALQEREGIRYREDGNIVFGYARIDVRDEVQQATYSVYRRMLALLDRLGPAHMLRIWHHVPRINEDMKGLERYRAFNRGRSLAFHDVFRADTCSRFSASSAVGGLGHELVAYFVASRRWGSHFENRRQMSAYRYPQRYGPRPPSFARATVAHPGDGGAFFLSGTASIVGHETVCVDDLVGQVDQTMVNIETLMKDQRRSIDSLSAWKVYVRRRDDRDRALEAMSHFLRGDPPVTFVEADICRADLLVEIEGLELESPSSISDSVSTTAKP